MEEHVRVAQDPETWEPPNRPTIWFASMHADAVRDLQVRLERLGYYRDDWGEPPGKFGPRTDAAVRTFQATVGLVSDGVVEEITWLNLYAHDPG